MVSVESLRNRPPGKWDPTRGRCPSLPESLFPFADFRFSFAAPNGGTLSDPGPVAPAPGPAAGGSPCRPAAHGWQFRFIFSPLRRARSARSIGPTGGYFLRAKRAGGPRLGGFRPKSGAGSRGGLMWEFTKGARTYESLINLTKSCKWSNWKVPRSGGLGAWLSGYSAVGAFSNRYFLVWVCCWLSESGVA